MDKLHNNNVLVTGGAGYIGSHACKALKLAGFNPVTFDNLSTGWREAVKFGPYVHGDLLERDVINNVFIDVLDDEDLIITEDTNSDDIAEWDSLNHIHLVVAIEKRFSLRFTSQEIQSWNNVGEMINSMKEKGI